MKIFAKLIPLTFLLCLICLGISYIFNIENLTYLHSYKNEAGLIIYDFDFMAYLDNININIITRATKDTIDISKFTGMVENYKTIWENGYQIGDITTTITNGFCLIINLVILMLNIPLTIARIIAGLILTALSLLGININSDSIILKSLNNFLDFATIPYLEPNLVTQISSNGIPVYIM